jgi:lipase
VKLHTHVWGDGPPVVCVHGVSAHGERFRRLAEERLGDRRVVAVDLRGHGRSGWEPPWNLETHVADLADTADAAGIESATWIGFSFGGRLVAELALRDPWRVERLVLLDPALHLPPQYALEAAEDEQTVRTFISREEAVDDRIAQGGLISTPREFIEEEMRQHLTETLQGRLVRRYSRPATIAAWGEMARPPVPPADLPTLLVLGTQSQVPNADSLERYRAALGDERLTVVSLEAGHNVLWDAFDETAEAVAGFA